MILSLCQWAQNTAFFTAIRGSWYVYPAIMATHLLGIALFGGMILVTNMRLLGLAMRNRSVSDVVDQLRVPKRVGLLIVVACGILMLGSKAEEYYYNIFFRLKLLLLLCVFLHGMVFRSAVYNNTAALDRAAKLPGQAKLAGFLSLLLWAGIVCAGRGIGYIEPPLDRIHAGLSARPPPVFVKYNEGRRAGVTQW
jgi:uncharacterized protein DUF6644